MNGKLGYVNLVLRREKEAVPYSAAELIADHFPGLCFLYNRDTRKIEHVNRKLAEYTGKDPDQLLERDRAAESIFHPGDISAFQSFLNSIGASRGATSGHFTARLADRVGAYRYHRLEGQLLNGSETQSALILFIANDITEELKSKEELEMTRELLDETEEVLQFGSWAWEISTNIVTWTPGLYSLLGYKPGDVEGRVGLGFYLSHVVEEYSQAFQEILSNSLAEKKDFTFEYVIKTSSGALKDISTRGKLVRTDNGEVEKMLCINRDITALRTFEKDQERNIRELNRSNRDLEEFAYIASHDLQEPLRKISMFTERLKAKYDKALDKEGDLYIERILVSAANMRTLIDDLLNFSRANRRSHTFDQVDLKAVLAGVISELELKIEETEAKISISDSLPILQAVTSEMKQLFANVLSNAIKFRKQNTPIMVEVRSGKLGRADKQTLGLPAGNNFHKIEVQDNGIGFEPEYAEKIFQIFQRLNGKSEYPGSGIGLAICKKIVEKHNGLIYANSLPDQGATFTIILPEKQF